MKHSHPERNPWHSMAALTSSLDQRRNHLGIPHFLNRMLADLLALLDLPGGLIYLEQRTGDLPPVLVSGGSAQAHISVETISHLAEIMARMGAGDAPDSFTLHGIPYTGVSLQFQERPLGLIGLQLGDSQKLTSQQQQILQVMTDQIRAGIDLSWLHLAQIRTSQQFSLLTQIVAAAHRAADLSRMLETVIPLFINLAGVQFGVAVLRNPHTRALTYFSSPTTPISLQQFQEQLRVESFLSHILHQGRPMAIAVGDDGGFLHQSASEPALISLVGLPIKSGDDPLGAFFLGCTTPQRLASERISTCQQAADQVALALMKLALLERERKQRAFAEAELRFSFTLMDVEIEKEVLEALFAVLKEMVPFHGASAMLLSAHDPLQGEVVMSSGYSDPGQAQGRQVYIKKYPLLERLSLTLAPVYIPDVRTSTLWTPGLQPDPQEVRTVFLAPIYLHRRNLLGSLTLKYFRPNALDAEEQRHIILLCNQTAARIQTVRLLHETKQRLQAVSRLANLSERLNRSIELEDVLRTVLEHTLSITQPDHQSGQVAAIAIREIAGSDRYLVSRVQGAAQQPHHFSVHTAQIAGDLWPSTPAAKEYPWQELTNLAPQSPIGQILGLHSSVALCIILQIKEIPMGILVLDHLIVEEGQRKALTALAELASAAIYKTRLLANAQQRTVELVQAYEELQDLDRIRNDFIHTASHELRTSLTYIRGYADMVHEGMLGETSPDQQEAIEVIQERTEAMVHLIQDLVDFRSMEQRPLDLQPTDVAFIVRTCVRAAQVAAEKGLVFIDWEASTPLPTIQADSKRLTQVIDNLLSNAIKFSPDGGHVQIRLYATETYLQIQMTDEGVGIPADQIRHIWDRFYRVPDMADRVHGTGLGLAIVRSVVEAHGGNVWAESSPRGSTFYVSLPV